ncbi:MAG: RNA recognition motif domain-containing protein, partial [Pseudobdellovibrio sp.]
YKKLPGGKMAKKIYVGNLAFSVTDDELQQAFASFGQITSARVVMDKMSGRSKGFGFVEIEDDAGADSAIEKMNGQTIAGRAIRVSEAKPQDPNSRPPRREGGGFGGGRGGFGGGGRGGPRRDGGGGRGGFGGGGNRGGGDY